MSNGRFIVADFILNPVLEDIFAAAVPGSVGNLNCWVGFHCRSLSGRPERPISNATLMHIAVYALRRPI